MNQATELEIVDLGDAKEKTMGLQKGPQAEENPVAPRREEI